MPKIIPIQEAARQQHELNEYRSGPHWDTNDFDRKNPIYGSIDVSEDWLGLEVPIGFFCVMRKETKLIFTSGYLPSHRERKRKIDAIGNDIIKAKGFDSVDPIAFSYTLMKFNDQGYYWSRPFITYQHDTRWVYDLLYRRVLIKRSIPNSLFFA